MPIWCQRGPVAPGDRRAREVQRRRHRAAAVERAGRLHHRGQVRLLVRLDRRDQGGDIERRDPPAASARRADSAGGMVGRSPCRFTTTSCRPCGSSARQRGVHPVRAARQRRDRSAPPCRRRRAPHRRSRHRRRPPPPGRYPPRAPRSSTCTIIGRPWMSASGLPGSRVEAMRDRDDDDRVQRPG